MPGDRRWYESFSTAEQGRSIEGTHSSGEELDRKYWIALMLYGVLALLVWFTMAAGKITVMGKPVELRLVPLVIIGGMALRTVLARQADRIRRGNKGSS